ncbi:hypothetical protein GLOIN_2v1472554 [Rhizophagus irregularis DAOM 181602=DAOM 197198]|uniref:Uncharacterized protein n=2 Tax=Rhizophagus irregularis TaxID=588596 RepID=A0A2P4QNV4_RHIID|nr:hypothetical protein GLOIN_2v1472554 [Rhizophagus irregularis DAOM 181602=DAOM 197198]POG79316.1 hypothetical protein GLOIN_2v1472554 [Rhizophagus irregularis DAOM 181602=DAOM 197198]|eukprot:XP_025186182.1 hypothetical protein GLOIN_2v1472554 [Rhizophagus irregularis DAOM 181602=DAOM 197198]
MSVNMQHVFFEMLIYIQIRDYFLDNEGDADVAYNEIIRFYYLQGGSVFSPKTIFLNPFRPPELKHKTNKGAPQKVVAKPCKPLQILRTLQSNSQNETNTFASEKRNTKRTRKNLRNTKEPTKEEIAIMLQKLNLIMMQAI